MLFLENLVLAFELEEGERPLLVQDEQIGATAFAGRLKTALPTKSAGRL
jgi:hypothetical protein